MSHPRRPDPIWEPPLHPPSSHSDASGNGGSHGDMRERVRALEVHRESIMAWLTAKAERLAGMDRRLEQGDQRMSGLQSRITGLDDATRRHGETISPLVERVTAIENKMRHAKERLQYAGAAVLLGLVAGGKVTIEQIFSALQALAKIAG